MPRPIFSTAVRGIFAMLLAAFFFSLMNGVVKILAHRFPPLMITFFRSATMVLILLLMLPIFPMSRTYQSGKWGTLLLRSAAGGLSMLGIFYNIATIDLGTATAFSQSMPLFVVLLSLFFLRHQLTPLIISASIVGFIGIICISDPQFGRIPAINILIGIGSSIGMAIAFINLSALKGYFHPRFIILSFGLTMTILSFILMYLKVPFLNTTWHTPTWEDGLYIALLGITGTISQHFLTKAYTLAPAGIIAPIDYMRLLFSLVIGIILGDAFPSFISGMGMLLIILSGMLIGLPLLLEDWKTTRKNKKYAFLRK